MRALVQRVKEARVTVSGQTVSEIGPGLLTLLGVGQSSTAAQLEWLIQKILKLRVFEDENGKLNLSLLDKGYEHLLVSQFTLYADATKGNRPSFIGAAPPDVAKAFYEKAIDLSSLGGARTQGGQFQAHMEVSLINDGPVTIWLEAPA